MNTRRAAIAVAAIVALAFILVLNRNYIALLGTALGGAAIAIALVGCCAIPLLLSLFGIGNREGEK